MLNDFGFTVRFKVLTLSQPLAATNVFIKVQNKATNTTTDDSGFYTIELSSGVNFIETSYVNHKKSSRKVILYQDGTLNINLEEKQ